MAAPPIGKDKAEALLDMAKLLRSYYAKGYSPQVIARATGLRLLYIEWLVDDLARCD